MMTAHSQNPTFVQPRPAEAGFTLVEIMVGLVIGMLAMLVVMQVFSVFEAQKRVTTGAADALTGGNISLYRIGRDIQQAGYGLISLSEDYTPLKCDPIHLDPALAASGVSGSISPLSIVNGASGVSDTVIVRYGSTDTGGVPVRILNMDVVGKTATIRTSLGCAKNDLTLVLNDASVNSACTISTATAVTPSSSSVDGTITLGDITNTAVASYLTCLGEWHEIVYQVDPDKRELQRQDSFVSADFVPTVAEIVNLQAQYGISDTADSNKVTQWVDPTGAWEAPTVTDRNRIKAVRIAVVARDAKMETSDITSPCSSLTGAAPTGLCAWDATSANPDNASPAPAIDLSASNADWRRYRYRVFETIVPLRNVLLSRSMLVP